MNPLIKALINLGGSGNIDEIYEEIITLEKFDEETLAVMHNPEKSNQTEIGYRLAWARTYLKKAGYLENSSRGIWALTDKARQVSEIDSREIVNYVRSLDKKASTTNGSPSDPESDDSPEEASTWRENLHHILTKKIGPEAFERLTQRMLRELGFIQVEVTGRTGDGGIDGKGIARISGLISFHIVFQCKRYKGSVGVPEIRDFRGASVGRADRGMFITTGSFTKAAIEEAKRDGATPIELIDGEELADKLKELSLGIKTESVEKVTVEPEWFLNL